MRVFISGVAGFLGSHLADAFIARGDQVVGIDNFIGGAFENVPSGVDFARIDCNELEAVKRAMRATDVVYHTAATPHEGLSNFAPYENAKNGYMASAAVFSAACSVGVKRIVHCSSMSRYGATADPPFTEDMVPRPEDPYGIGKWASELMLKNLCETHGVEWTVAIPHNIYGARQCQNDPFRNVISIFINFMLHKRQPYVYGDGSQERCFSHYTDCVEPLVKMATLPEVVSEAINIGPDREVITVLEVAKLIANLMSFDFDPVFKPARPREVKFAHCSADKARRLLGYESRVSLSDGLMKTIEWYKKRGPKPFSYHMLQIEIDSPKLPETWAKRLF